MMNMNSNRALILGLNTQWTLVPNASRRTAIPSLRPIISIHNIATPDLRSAISIKAVLVALSLAFLLSSYPVAAQSNPDVTDCGLPAGGDIVQTVTYDLSADCELTTPLKVAAAADMTINGQGHTITTSDEYDNTQGMIIAKIVTISTPTVTLNQLTLDAQRKPRQGRLDVDKLIANKVTFQNTSLTVWGALSTANRNWNLTDVLFRKNRGSSGGQPTVLLFSDGTLSLNNVAFEDNLLGSARCRSPAALR